MSASFPDARLSIATARARYGDAQGNILKGHGRRHTMLFFVEFSDPARTAQWIGQLVKGLSTGPNATTDTVRITTTEKQLADSSYFAANQQDAGLFTSLLFTAAGLDFLQAPAPQEAPDQAPGQGRLDAFAIGMRAASTRALLADPDPADHWDKEWWDAQGQPAAIHALLLLADDEPTRLTPAVAFMRERSESLGVRVRIEQAGERLVEDGHDIEHFGYADGVSQPLYVQGAPDVTPHQRDVALGAEELVLVPDALDPTGQGFGSFMVFRKLQQHVRAFKDAEGEDAAPGKGGLANELHLEEEDRARAGAMVVGRFENGTPLTLSATAAKEQPGKPVFTNDFTYSEDKEGLKCPFHAHIRKMNPRGETETAATAGAELRHRITRRGVPYGPQLPDGKPEDGVSRGLLFMCYQRNIGQQFEFMQAAWGNNPKFVCPQFKVGPETGLDPVIGQGPRQKLTFPTTWDEPATQAAAFAQHVFLNGGDYFYAPSRQGLEALAKGATA